MAKTTKSKKDNELETLTYDNIIDAFRLKVAKATAPVDACVATQITLYGSVEGVLYIVIANGIAKVEPFDYKGADIEVDADADVFMSVLNGNKALSTAIADGDIKMQGNAGKAIILGSTAFFNK
ncbi:MAG: SCP2 sterol-binding domain-containing protein [Oscillospiraceae bacterium]|nr:SCP2 sterol-binding domain-containing protein [Oscillospiraceae bacterium]